MTSHQSEVQGAGIESDHLEILKPMLEVGFEPQLIVNKIGTILFFNQTAGYFFEFSNKDEHTSLFSLLGVECIEAAEFLRKIDTHDPLSWEQKIPYRGHHLDVEVHSSRITLAQQAQYYLVAIKDISKSVLSEKLIKESEARRQFALDAAQIGDWDMDLTTNIAQRSLRHDQCFGYDSQIEKWGYDTFLAHVHPDDRPRVDRTYKDALTGNGVYDVEFRVIWPDETVHWLWSKGQFYFDTFGNPIRVSGIQVEITSKRLAVQSMRINTRALESVSNGVTIADITLPDMPLVYVNPAFEKMSGYDACELLGKNCRFLSKWERDEESLGLVREAIFAEQEIQIELKNFKKDGTPFWNELRLSPVKNEMGIVTHYVGIQNDVTQRRKQAEAMKYQAEHDSLTGLFNRHYFIQFIGRLITDSTINNEVFALIYLDLDNFKRINDALGHDTGDQLLCHVSKVLEHTKGSSNVSIRLGGDEFVILCPNTNRSHVDSILSEIQIQLTKAMLFKHLQLVPTASFGVVFFPQDGITSKELLKNADLAMYSAKSQGRNCVAFFTPDMDVVARSDLTIEIELTRALAEDEIYLEYQPQLSLESGKLIGIEALARWMHPTLGQVSPVDFIRVAENTGLIHKLGHYLMRLACEQNSLWIHSGVCDVPIAVNVSALQFRSGDFVESIKEVLVNSGLPAQKLEIELTESIIMQGTDTVFVKLSELQSLGIKMSIDDFGTGYSSLSYLRHFPINRLKIDKSFINDAVENESSAAITRSIVMLSHNLGFEVIAEGVETLEQVALLKKLKCDEAQGYLFSKPLKPQDFEVFACALVTSKL